MAPAGDLWLLRYHRDVQRDGWDKVVMEFLFHRDYTDRTREVYTLTLRRFLDWCATENLDPVDITSTDLLSFQSALGRTMARETAMARFRNLKSFYNYLQKRGIVAVSPAHGMSGGPYERAVRNTISLEELGRLWDRTSGRSRVIIGMLALCSLRRTELMDSRLEDLHTRDGVRYLHIPSRTGRYDTATVAVPEILVREIDSFRGSRRTGFLVPGQGVDGRLATTSIHKLVKRAARDADLPGWVTSLTLTFTLRALALENRFSYVSVISSVSETDMRRLAPWVRNVDVSAIEAASIRLGRMLQSRVDLAQEALLQADILSVDPAVHPVASVTLAASVLEKCLRDVVKRHGIEVTKREPSISTYTTLLRGRGLITISELRACDLILGYRNDAAHGWFDQVSRDDARWVVSECQSMVAVLTRRGASVESR